jgi:phage host-nuclease inhibitor protein Gam
MKIIRISRGFVVVDLLILIAILVVVAVCWSYSWYWIDTHIQAASPGTSIIEARGQFGDKFGAINSLFSGFAFAAIIFTIVLQNRELNSTKEAMQEQGKTANSQRFDTTFFQLISLHNDITAKLTDLQHTGRLAFSTFHERTIQSDPDFSAFCALGKLSREEIRLLKDKKANNDHKIPESYKARLSDSDIANIESLLEKGVAFCDNYLDESIQMHERKIREAYTAAAALHIDKYSHYFRNLYHILKFIKESPLVDDLERNRYAKIVRSQLSEVELVALFYNSLTEIKLPGREDMELGYPKMGKLLVDFDLLQNLSPMSIIHASHKQIFLKNYGVPR